MKCQKQKNCLLFFSNPFLLRPYGLENQINCLSQSGASEKLGESMAGSRVKNTLKIVLASRKRRLKGIKIYKIFETLLLLKHQQR